MLVSIDTKSLQALLDLEKDLESAHEDNAETREKLYSYEDDLRNMRTHCREKDETIRRLEQENFAFRDNPPTIPLPALDLGNTLESRLVSLRALIQYIGELQLGNAEHKIKAIKCIREVTRGNGQCLGLKEAKDIIEEYQRF